MALGLCGGRNTPGGPGYIQAVEKAVANLIFYLVRIKAGGHKHLLDFYAVGKLMVSLPPEGKHLLPLPAPIEILRTGIGICA